MRRITKAVFPVAGSRHPIPAGDQGEPEGNAAGRRQAADPVRGRGSRRGRNLRHDLHHGAQQAVDRGSFRQGLRARDGARASQQDRAAEVGAGGDPARHQLHLHPADRGARPRSRGAVRRAGRGRRALRRDPRGRPHRRRSAGDAADDRGRDARERVDHRGDGGPGGRRRQLGHRRNPPDGRTVRAHLAHRRKAQARNHAVDAGRGRPLRADAADLPPSARHARGRRRRNPVDRRHRAPARRREPSSPTASRAGATTAAASSAISRRRSISGSSIPSSPTTSPPFCATGRRVLLDDVERASLHRRRSGRAKLRPCRAALFREPTGLVGRDPEAGGGAGCPALRAGQERDHGDAGGCARRRAGAKGAGGGGADHGDRAGGTEPARRRPAPRCHLHRRAVPAAGPHSGAARGRAADAARSRRKPHRAPGSRAQVRGASTSRSSRCRSRRRAW